MAERIDHGSFVGRAVRDGVIDPSRSIQVGIRTHAPEDCGIRIVYGHEVEDMSAGEIASTILDHVGDMACYVTFDIDCLDPAFAPGTGTRRWPVAPPAPRCSRCCRNSGGLISRALTL
jgi:agmatinase